MGKSTRRVILKTLGAILLIVIGVVGWTGFKVWRSWNAVPKVVFDLSAARELLETAGPVATTQVPSTSPDGTPVTDASEDTLPPGVEYPPPPPPVPDAKHGVFLAVGTENQLGGLRADAILLFMLPEGGGQPLLVSLPRDLYVKSPCTQKFNRINVNLNGCREVGVTGPELLAIAVEDSTGLRVDHVTLFDFEGFQDVIDEVDGIEICVTNAVRDSKAELRLNAGCSIVGGEQALAWVRSRSTLELVDGQWRSMRGVSDLTRNERQQDVILQLLTKMGDFSSLGQLTDTIESLAHAFTVDEGLSLKEAAEVAWSLRGLDPALIARIKIPVRNYTTPRGAQVLLPTMTFTELLAEIYPDIVDA